MSQLHQPYGNTESQTTILCQRIEESTVCFGGVHVEMQKQQNTEIHSTLAKPCFRTTPV